MKKKTYEYKKDAIMIIDDTITQQQQQYFS